MLKNRDVRARDFWLPEPSPPCPDSDILDKLLKLSVLLFPHVHIGMIRSPTSWNCDKGSISPNM